MINASILSPGKYSSAGIGKSTCFNMSTVKTLQSTIDAFIYQNPKGISPADCIGLSGSYAQSNAFTDGMTNMAVEVYADVNSDPVNYLKVVPRVNRLYPFSKNEKGELFVRDGSTSDGKKGTIKEIGAAIVDRWLRLNVNDFLRSVTILGSNGIIAASCCTWKELLDNYRNDSLWSYSDSRAVRSCYSGTMNVTLNSILENMSEWESAVDQSLDQKKQGIYVGELVPVKIVYANKATVYLIIRNNVDLLVANNQTNFVESPLWEAFERRTCYSVEHILVSYDYPKDYKFPLSMFEAEGFGSLVTMGNTVSGNAGSLKKEKKQKKTISPVQSFAEFKKSHKNPSAEKCQLQWNSIYTAYLDNSVDKQTGFLSDEHLKHKAFSAAIASEDTDSLLKVWWLSNNMEALNNCLSQDIEDIYSEAIGSDKMLTIVYNEANQAFADLEQNDANDDASLVDVSDSDLLDRGVKEYPERVSLRSGKGKWITVNLNAWSIWNRYGIVESLKDFNYIRTNSASGTSEGGKSTEIKQNMQQTTLNSNEISNVPSSIQDIKDIATLASMMNGSVVSFAVSSGSLERGFRTKLVPFRLRSERILGGRSLFYSDVFYTHHDLTSKDGKRINNEWLQDAPVHELVVSRIYRPNGGMPLLANWAIIAHCGYDSQNKLNHSSFSIEFLGTCALNSDAVKVTSYKDWTSYENYWRTTRTLTWLGQIVNSVSCEGTEAIIAANAPINLWYYPAIQVSTATGDGLEGRRTQAVEQLEYTAVFGKRSPSAKAMSSDDYVRYLMVQDSTVPHRITGSIQTFELLKEMCDSLWNLKGKESEGITHLPVIESEPHPVSDESDVQES